MMPCPVGLALRLLCRSAVRRQGLAELAAAPLGPLRGIASVYRMNDHRGLQKRCRTDASTVFTYNSQHVYSMAAQGYVKLLSLMPNSAAKIAHNLLFDLAETACSGRCLDML